VSLSAAGRPVAGARVQLQVATARGWTPPARSPPAPTAAAPPRSRFGATTRVRAVAPGTAVSSADASREMLVRSTSRPLPASAPPRARGLSLGGFRAAAVRIALGQRGKPYRYGSTGPSSFDCSGLVNYAFRAVGKPVPRTSSQLRRWTKPVSRAAAQPGDLGLSPGHVGIYVSPGVMVDAPNSGGRVSVRKIYARNYTIGRVV
jgi:cell wall-associated NlpC family hydrolase